MRFVIRLLINALALWLTVLILHPHVQVSSWESAADGTDWSWPLFWTYVLLAVIFGVVNGIVGTAIKIVAFPLYILTLGLFTLVVNALMLMLTAWITGHTDWGLRIDTFGTAVLGALIISIVSFVLSVALPSSRKR